MNFFFYFYEKKIPRIKPKWMGLVDKEESLSKNEVSFMYIILPARVVSKQIGVNTSDRLGKGVKGACLSVGSVAREETFGYGKWVLVEVVSGVDLKEIGGFAGDDRVFF